MTSEEAYIASLASTEDGLNVTYEYEYTDETVTEGMYDFYAVPQIVFVSVLCVFIIVGNSCVLAAIRLSENGRKSRMNFFIMHLALADLLVGIMVCLADIASKITIEWYAGNAFCKILQYSQAVVTYASTFMLVSLSIDRYDAVARPMNFSRSGYQGRFLVYTAWLVSFLFALPALFIYTETIEEGKRQCWLDFPELWHWQLFLSAVAVVTFLMPAVIIASCYIAIIYIIWTKGQSHEPHCPGDRMVLHQGGVHTTTTRLPSGDMRHESGRGIIPQAKIRTIKMTLIIVIVFILCWSPYFLYNLLDIYELLPVNNPMTTLIQSAAPLNSAANPIIYGIFSTRICKNLRRIPMPSCIRQIVCRCKETKRCNTFTFRGRNHKFLASQTTDPTMTTYEAHKRSNQCLNDIRLSPLKPCDRRYASLITKRILDRAIFAETAGDLLKKRDHDKKLTLFKLTRHPWMSDKISCDFEMGPLPKREITRNLPSSGSDDSSANSDSNGRFPTVLNIKETNISVERDDSKHSDPISDKDENETLLNTLNLQTKLPAEESDRNSEVKLENETSKISESKQKKRLKRAPSSVDQELSPVTICKDEKSRERTPIHVECESVVVPSNSKTIPKLAQVETRSFEQFTELVLENNLPKDREVTSVGSTSKTKAEHTQRSVHGKRLANRRPSGVPSVRRQLTSDESALLSNLAGKWRVNELKADKSSVVE